MATAATSAMATAATVAAATEMATAAAAEEQKLVAGLRGLEGELRGLEKARERALLNGGFDCFAHEEEEATEQKAREVAVMRERLSQVRSLMVEAAQALSEAAEPWPGSC
jgi:hypothetical protein